MLPTGLHKGPLGKAFCASGGEETQHTVQGRCLTPLSLWNFLDISLGFNCRFNSMKNIVVSWSKLKNCISIQTDPIQASWPPCPLGPVPPWLFPILPFVLIQNHSCSKRIHKKRERVGEICNIQTNLVFPLSGKWLWESGKALGLSSYIRTSLKSALSLSYSLCWQQSLLQTSRSLTSRECWRFTHELLQANSRDSTIIVLMSSLLWWQLTCWSSCFER